MAGQIRFWKIRGCGGNKWRTLLNSVTLDSRHTYILVLHQVDIKFLYFFSPPLKIKACSLFKNIQENIVPALVCVFCSIFWWSEFLSLGGKILSIEKILCFMWKKKWFIERGVEFFNLSLRYGLLLVWQITCFFFLGRDKLDDIPLGTS